MCAGAGHYGATYVLMHDFMFLNVLQVLDIKGGHPQF
jgi:hypothetical protein